MCKYCKWRKAVEFNEGHVKKMTLGINEPLFYKRAEYLGEDPFGREVFRETGFVGIDFLKGKYVLTDG